MGPVEHGLGLVQPVDAKSPVIEQSDEDLSAAQPQGKTMWGSCNAQARRIWLNLELAKKPPERLEYILVHELVHLLVRHHDARFHALMDRHLPRWKLIRSRLGAEPLAEEPWV